MPDDNSMRSRIHGSRFRLWLLVGANRWVVAALVLAIVFGSLAILVALDPVPLGEVVENSDPIETVFQAMLTSIITGVTLVVTINQLVLSQELGAVGDQRERMQGSLEFRENVAEEIDVPVSPADPAVFFQAILDAIEDRARQLEDRVSTADPDSREEFEAYVEELVQSTEVTRVQLEDAEFGSFDVVGAILGFNYSLKIYEGKRLAARYGEDAPEGERALDEEGVETLDTVLHLLEQFGLAREHVKTLYFQWALVDLGRAMLYSSIPALAVSTGSMLVLDDAGTIGGSLLGVSNLAWLVLLAVTVSLAPFAILLSYVLRIATVTKHTLAIGPFILREADRSRDES